MVDGSNLEPLGQFGRLFVQDEIQGPLTGPWRKRRARCQARTEDLNKGIVNGAHCATLTLVTYLAQGNVGEVLEKDGQPWSLGMKRFAVTRGNLRGPDARLAVFFSDDSRHFDVKLLVCGQIKQSRADKNSGEINLFLSPKKNYKKYKRKCFRACNAVRRRGGHSLGRILVMSQ